MTAPSTEAALRFLFSDLKDYETRVLTCLLENGDWLGAYKINIKTDVPRTKVYGVFKSLVEKGLALFEMRDQWADVVFPENWEDYGQSGKMKFKKRHGVALYQYLSMGKANLDTIKERVIEIRSRLDRAEDLLDVAYMKNGIPLTEI